IVPMGPEVQSTGEAPGAPYEVRIYPGADARFTLYEDDGDTYAYERGQRATYDLVWNDRARTLSVGARRGSFPGLIRRHRLDLVLVDPAHGTGIASAPAVKHIDYDGHAQLVRFAPHAAR